MFLASVWILTAAQRFGGSSLAWLEFSRFLPYPLLLAPVLVTVAATWALGREWRGAAVTTLLMVATVGMGLAWRVGDEPAAVGGGSAVRLMTWNAKSVQASERPGGTAALQAEVVRQHPDVVAMQDADALRHLAGATPHTAPGQGMAGLPFLWADGQYLVASRIPLADCRQVDAGGLRFARCTVLGASPFELVTVHFESPRAGLMAARREGIEGVQSWQANLTQRLGESRALAGAVAAAPGSLPRVIAGDLNATVTSDVVRQLLDAGYADAYTRAGRGYGYTYGHTLRPAFSFLRIDHILVSAGIAVRDCAVGTALASDHRAAICDVSIRPAAP